MNTAQGGGRVGSNAYLWEERATLSDWRDDDARSSTVEHRRAAHISDISILLGLAQTYQCWQHDKFTRYILFKHNTIER